MRTTNEQILSVSQDNLNLNLQDPWHYATVTYIKRSSTVGKNFSRNMAHAFSYMNDLGHDIMEMKLDVAQSTIIGF
jgi:hypothetical protein